MLTRIVKLNISSNHIEDFINLFNDNKSKILNFSGCNHVEIMREFDNENIFFTYSHWQNTSSLEKYRESSTFKEIWKKTKTYFCDKPEAWSLKKINS
jgi:quinol monooxygenase YgiN